MRERLAAIEPACAGLELLHADVGDPDALRAVAESTHVVATTVGPYLSLGEPLVAACAQAGTDYADLTGEPEFVDRMYVRHHATAVATGARLVHACGFDSIPHDLGVLFTVEQLPEGVPLMVRGFVRAGGKPSAGTFHSAVTSFSRVRQAGTAHLERRRIEPRPHRSVVGQGPRALRALARRLGAAAADDRRAGRQALGRRARALRARLLLRPLRRRQAAAGRARRGRRRQRCVRPVAAAADALVAAGAHEAGDGPSPAQRERSWFKVRFIGEGGGRRVVTEVAGGDPGYDETSKMLAESALCLATDDLPPTAGQVTTAVAMGDALIERLRAARASGSSCSSRVDPGQPEPARILVVANRTAATPALIEAVRARARGGRCSFALLVPQLACEVPYGDEEAKTTLELAIPLLEEAAGGEVTPMIGSADALLAVERVLVRRALRRGDRLDASRARVQVARARPPDADRAARAPRHRRAGADRASPAARAADLRGPLSHL